MFLHEIAALFVLCFLASLCCFTLYKMCRWIFKERYKTVYKDNYFEFDFRDNCVIIRDYKGEILDVVVV